MGRPIESLVLGLVEDTSGSPETLVELLDDCLPKPLLGSPPLVARRLSTSGSGGVLLELGSALPITLTRADVLSEIRQGGSIAALITSQLLRAELPGSQGDEVPVAHDAADRLRAAISDSLPRVAFRPASIAETPALAAARDRGREGLDLILLGSSSSGKTVAASQLAEELEESGGQSVWVDLADPLTSVVGVVLYLLGLAASDRTLVVLDDFQSAPTIGSQIVGCLNALGLIGSSSVSVCAATWPDALDHLRNQFNSASVIRFDGGEASRRILSGLDASQQVIDRLVTLSEGDALLAELARNQYAVSRSVPSADELSAIAYGAIVNDQTLSEEEALALWQVASLGSLEIDAQVSLLSGTSRAAIAVLTERGVVRARGDFVYFGHRSAAGLVEQHSRSLLAKHADLSPVRFAVDYLRRAGDDQIRQTLDRLDLVAIANADDQFGAAFLAHCWSSVRVLSRFIARSVAEDPSWGDNVASAVFAGESLAHFRLTEEWESTALYVRSRWGVAATDHLPSYSGDPPAEADDFSTIQDKMRAEDAAEPGAFDLLADDVDVDRFHRTWVLGLLLGFEATAIVPDPDRLEGLKRMAREAQAPDGSFYPARVPWVTARVCLGLSAGGETVRTSDVLERASAWLRSRPPRGPFRSGFWRSGTGVWNTDLQVTAMVLLALGRMGADPADRGLRTALAYLREGRGEWYRPGKEIDCAQAVEAAMVLGGSWRDYSGEMRSLLDWAQDSRAWETTWTLASEVQDESSKVPAVAGALVSVVWETVRTELPLLLQGAAQTLADEAEVPVGLDEALGHLHGCIRRLDEATRRNLADREMHVASGGAPSSVTREYERWKAIDAEISRIRQALSSAPDQSFEDVVLLQTKVDELGTSALGNAW